MVLSCCGMTLKHLHSTDLGMPRHKRIIPRHVALGFLCETGSCRGMKNHAWACSSTFSIFSIFGHFSSPLWSFCSSITYKIKITCKSSQNDDKQGTNTKYKRVKYMYNSPLSAFIHCIIYMFSYLK